MDYRILCSSYDLHQEQSQSTYLTSYNEIIQISTQKLSLGHGSSLTVLSDVAIPQFLSGRAFCLFVLKRHNSQQVQFHTKARTVRLIPHLLKTLSSLGTGTSSPAAGEHSPGAARWGWGLHAAPHGRCFSKDTPVVLCSIRWYEWRTRVCERLKVFFPTNTQVRVS